MFNVLQLQDQVEGCGSCFALNQAKRVIINIVIGYICNDLLFSIDSFQIRSLESKENSISTVVSPYINEKHHHYPKMNYIRDVICDVIIYTHQKVGVIV